MTKCLCCHSNRLVRRRSLLARACNIRAPGSSANINTPVANGDYSGELRGGDEDNIPMAVFARIIFVCRSERFFLAKCLLYLLRVTEILAFKHSPSNQKKHVEVGWINFHSLKPSMLLYIIHIYITIHELVVPVRRRSWPTTGVLENINGTLTGAWLRHRRRVQ